MDGLVMDGWMAHKSTRLENSSPCDFYAWLTVALQ